MKKIQISPSILSADFSELGSEIKKLEESGADMIHVDVMDGHFVPNLSFGYNMVKTLRPITKKIFDVHLMISPVEPFIKEFIDAGSDIISFHPEADKNTKEIISIIKKSNCKVGIAVHPNIKIEEIKEFLNDVDLVIIMTVIPGFGGQKFLEDQVQKISELKEIRKNINANYEIEIDGGINFQTSKICIDKGADILVAGSYVYGAPKEEYKDKINSIRHLT